MERDTEGVSKEGGREEGGEKSAEDMWWGSRAPVCRPSSPTVSSSSTSYRLEGRTREEEQGKRKQGRMNERKEEKKGKRKEDRKKEK